MNPLTLPESLGNFTQSQWGLAAHLDPTQRRTPRTPTLEDLDGRDSSEDL